jgi:subtilisin family serine protease
LEHKSPSIRTKKINDSFYIDELSRPRVYEPLDFGFDVDPCLPSGLNIAILDSGLPNHKDFSNIKGLSNSNSIDLLSVRSDIFDNTGHSTAVSGLIASSNPSGLYGLAPNCNFFFAKILDDENKGDINSLVSGLLWSLAKNVDIIIISSYSDFDSNILRDCIKKCHNSNICIFASRFSSKVERSEYPSSYDEVFKCSVGDRSEKSSFSDLSKNTYHICYKNTPFITSYRNDKYLKFYGSSAVSAICGGVAAHLIYKLKNENKNFSVNNIYSTLINIFNTSHEF